MNTKAIVASCQECGRDYFTYIPDTNCQMPDGSKLFYQEAQLLCPVCDSEEFGWWFNQELFPELAGRTP